MKTVMVISPSYLSALLKESDKFSFCIQGYGSFENAHSGLVKTNVSELIGFAYVGKTLPIENSKDYLEMLEFLEMLDGLEEKRRIVFLTISSGGYLRRLAKKFSNVEIFRVEGVQDITDTVIDKDVFGNIILFMGSPYKLIEQTGSDLPYEQNDDWKLHYKHVMNPDVLRCLEDVVELGNLNETLINDEVYNMFLSSGNNLYAIIRQNVVAKRCGINDADLIRRAKNMINSNVSGADWCILMVMLEGVE